MARALASARALPSAVLESAAQFADCAAVVSGNITASVNNNTGAVATVSAATIDGRACLKLGPLTAGAFSQLNLLAATPLALAGKRTMHVLAWCADWLSLGTFSAIRIEFDNGGSPDATNYLNSTNVTTHWLDGGWVLFETFFNESGISSMSKQGTAATVESYIKAGQVKRVGIRINSGAAVPDIYIGGVWFGGATRPKIIIGYDGCYISQKNVALPTHQLYGIPGTLYVAKHKLGQAGYLSDADLDTFYAAGWAIAMHSWASTSGYNDASAYPSTQSIVDAIGAFQDWQRSRGFTRGLGHACWPYVAPSSMSAAERARVMPAILQSGLKTIRHAGTQTAGNVRSLAIASPETVKQVYSPQLQTNGAPVTVATALGYLQQAQRYRGNAHVYIHEITPNGSTGGGDGATNSVGANYWRDDFFSGSATAFIESVAGQIRAGIYDAATIAEYD